LEDFLSIKSLSDALCFLAIPGGIDDVWDHARIENYSLVRGTVVD